MNKDIYYPYFDYLRLALASIVMFGHDGLISWEHSGQLAVDVFFALSGWLIGGLLLNIKNTQELPQFYFNRAVRIWIPYYIALVLIVIASVIKDPIDLKWFEFVFYKLTWVYNLYGPPQLQNCVDCMPLNGTANHFWSVNAEEQFYLLAPILIVGFSRIGRSILVWLTIAILLLFSNTYASISFGVVAALVNHRFPNFHEQLALRAVTIILFIVSAIGMFIDTNYQFYAPFFAVSTVLLLSQKGGKSQLGAFLGGISYPLYLNHWIGVFFFNLVLEPLGLRESGLRHILAALLNYAIAAWLYWYIERRALAMRREWFSLRRSLALCNFAYLSIVTGLGLGLVLYPSTGAIILFFVFSTTYLTAYFLVKRASGVKSAIN